MADVKKYELNDDLAAQIRGGRLSGNWKQLISAFYPTMASQYEGITYDEAVDLIRGYLSDEQEVQTVAAYIKEMYF